MALKIKPVIVDKDEITSENMWPYLNKLWDEEFKELDFAKHPAVHPKPKKKKRKR